MDQLAERVKNMTPLQRAVFALKETQARLDALEQKRVEPIAIVGMACRFPGGANDPASYWRLLCDGVDAIGEIPPDRWNIDDFYDPDPAAPGKMCTRCGGFLERIDEFDNHFFAISDREAARIDPQQRMLLELAWEALEDAGLPPSALRGTKTGVFVGISMSEYGMMLSTDPTQTDAHVATGTSLCLAANRLSFAFGFQGPSLALDTACSSSLVAVHLACQHLRNGECDAALAGGANLVLSPIGTVNLSKAGFCAPDGRVRAFDAAAAGYVRGEGAGLLLLKPLSAAVKNRDPIYAVIRGSAVNQNGTSNGVTAPSRAAQEQVLREAYARAKVSPGQVQYVETQGTGTRLGDTIEATALGAVLREGRPAQSRCAIGAVKTNIGHLEAASGIASLMKAALALKHRQLPPNLHFQTPNPDIPFDTLPLRVLRKLEPWLDGEQPRFAGVSAFGFGGSNAHVVLEEAPADSLPSPFGRGAGGEGVGGNGFEDSPQSPSFHASHPHPNPLPKGEGTETNLPPKGEGTIVLPLSARTEKALHDLAQRYTEFLGNDPPVWSDVCHTAASRRDHHDCRLAVLADSEQQAIRLLGDFLNTVGTAVVRPHPGRGGGATATPTLTNGHPRARVLTGRKPYGRGLKIAFLYGAQGKDWSRYCRQLVEVVPRLAAATEDIDAVVQRVAGWPLATVLNGDFRWDDPKCARPGLLALQLALSAWWRYVGIAPDAVLGHGIGELAAACVAGILTAEEVLQVAIGRGGGLQPRPASLPFLSAVDGKSHPGPDLTAQHWQSCLEDSHALAEAFHALANRQVDVCLEIGPRSALEESLPSLRQTDGGRVDVLSAVATLYAAGADLLWPRLAPAEGRCVRVPTYPWQRQRLWAPSKHWLGTPPGAKSPPDKAAEPVATPEVRRRSDLTAPFVGPRTKLEEVLAESWSTVLGFDRVGVHDNFLELGGDSLQATILLNRLQDHLGEAVPAHTLFQVQTVGDLAEYLRREFPEAVRRCHPDEQVDGAAHSAAAPSPSIPRLARGQQAEQLLARLDELTDDEVESLLGQAAAQSEVPHE